MESELNKKIRELLEKFGIETEYPKAKVIGKWSLIGHLKNLVEESLEKAIQEAREEAVLDYKYDLIEWCQCGKKCKPINKGSNRCKNSGWSMFKTKKEYIFDTLSLKERRRSEKYKERLTLLGI